MHKRIATGLAAGVLSGVVGLGGVAHAAPKAVATAGTHAGGHGPLRGLIQGQVGRWLVLKSKLNLTDEQKAKVHGVIDAHRPEIAAVAKDVVAKKRVLREAVDRDNPDEKTVRAAADAMGKTLGDAAVLAGKLRGEIRPLLTDEQRKALGEFRADSEQAVDAWVDQIGKS